MPALPAVDFVYVAVNPKGRTSHPEVPLSGFTLQLGCTETGRKFIPVFTDEELGKRWMAREQVDTTKLRCLSVPKAYKKFLEDALGSEPDCVGYDPVSEFQVFKIQTVLNELRQRFPQ
jgi:hypothetical protein